MPRIVRSLLDIGMPDNYATLIVSSNVPGEMSGWVPGSGSSVGPGGFLPLHHVSGLTYCHSHVLRHMYASMLIENGKSLAYVCDQLGHSSIKIAVDTYGPIVPGANKAAADRLDEALGHTLCAPRGIGTRDKEDTVND